MNPSTTDGLLRWGKRALPWVSLALGTAGAVMMDRNPERGAVVAVLGLATWALLLLAIWLRRARPCGPSPAQPGRLRLGARFTSLLLTQSAIHLQLYFVLPYYFKAWAGTAGHTIFVGLVCIAALVSLWDPLTEWLLTRTRYGLLLPALSNFVVLAAVLPALGFANGTSLWIAAATSAVALPVVVMADRLVDRDRGLVAAGVVGLLIPGALALGAARFVPAVPMHLVSAEIGTRQEGRGVADPTDHFDGPPGRMLCATATGAPLGLRDELLHVWRHDGVVVDRIPLQLAGGREDGFRTWSSKRNFGPDPAGTWSCAVETASGQFLGERRVTIGP
jgi:hypothetical protein